MEKLSLKISKDKIVYLALSASFFLTAGILFIVAARALYRQSNILFGQSGTPQSVPETLPQDIVAIQHKLGIVPATTSVAPVVATVPTPVEVVKTEPVVAPKDVRIVVFSSITTAGAASALKLDLEAAGFVVVKIGNQRPALTNTTIQIKDAKRAPIDALRELVAKKYVLDPITVLADTVSDYDAIIVIGKTETPAPPAAVEEPAVVPPVEPAA